MLWNSGRHTRFVHAIFRCRSSPCLQCWQHTSKLFLSLWHSQSVWTANYWSMLFHRKWCHVGAVQTCTVGYLQDWYTSMPIMQNVATSSATMVRGYCSMHVASHEGSNLHMNVTGELTLQLWQWLQHTHLTTYKNILEVEGPPDCIVDSTPTTDAQRGKLALVCTQTSQR